MSYLQICRLLTAAVLCVSWQIIYKCHSLISCLASTLLQTESAAARQDRTESQPVHSEATGLWTSRSEVTARSTQLNPASGSRTASPPEAVSLSLTQRIPEQQTLLLLTFFSYCERGGLEVITDTGNSRESLEVINNDSIYLTLTQTPAHSSRPTRVSLVHFSHGEPVSQRKFSIGSPPGTGSLQAEPGQSHCLAVLPSCVGCVFSRTAGPDCASSLISLRSLTSQIQHRLHCFDITSRGARKYFFLWGGGAGARVDGRGPPCEE